MASHFNSRKRPALLMLDDRLGLMMALAASRQGHQFAPYVVALDGGYSTKIQLATDRLRWDLTVIAIPTDQIRFDFVRLAAHHQCVTRSEFEYGFAIMHACCGVREDSILLTGNDIDAGVTRVINRIANRHDKRLTLLPPPQIPTNEEIAALIEGTSCTNGVAP